MFFRDRKMLEGTEKSIQLDTPHSSDLPLKTFNQESILSFFEDWVTFFIFRQRDFALKLKGEMFTGQIGSLLSSRLTFAKFFPSRLFLHQSKHI